MTETPDWRERAGRPDRPRVLIVDDDSVVRQALGWALKEHGYQVCAVDSSAVATPSDSPAACATDVDVILLGASTMLDGGAKLLEVVKRDGRWRDVPVLLSSPAPSEYAAPRALALGASDYLERPLRVDDLLARVGSQLRARAALLATREALRDAEEELARTRDELRGRHRLIASARAENARLAALAQTDPLTRLLNRRGLCDRLAAELDRTRRYGTVVSLLLVDLDHFKQVNDTYGHLTGDQALRAVASVLRLTARSVDLVARYGGEEFVVALPETAEAGAITFAERIRERIEAHRFQTSPTLRVTASVGVAWFPSQHAETVEDLLARADEALYRAKADGRNRVCT